MVSILDISLHVFPKQSQNCNYSRYAKFLFPFPQWLSRLQLTCILILSAIIIGISLLSTMGARHSTNNCAYDTLFSVSVLHIHEKIFLSLDYESFKNCLEVSKSWNRLLTSESFHKKAKCVFVDEILWDSTHVYEAAYKGNVDKVRRILLSGLVNMDLEIEYGFNRTTLLIAAAHEGRRDVVQLLLKKGALPDKSDACGKTPLSIASLRGQKDVVEVLLKFGADPNIADCNGTTPLYHSASRGDKEVVQLLLDFGAQPNEAAEDGSTPLHMSALWGVNTKTVQILLNGGANPNVTNKFGTTPLHEAASCGRKEMSQVLLKAGGDPNKVNSEDRTPLHHAAMWGNHDVYQVLLAGGGDPHRVDKFGRMSHYYASQRGLFHSESCVLM